MTPRALDPVAHDRRVRSLRELRREPGYVDATAVREHLAVLHAWGWVDWSIAQASGLSHHGVTRIRTGASARVQFRSARRLLAVDPAAQQRPGLLPAHGVHRRVEALMALGWSMEAIGAAAGGRTRRQVQRFHAQPSCTAETWRVVDDAYRGLCMRVGPSQRARALAARRGWVPPLAWDDIDHPDARPWQPTPGGEDLVDEVAVERALRGDRRVVLTRAERHAVIDHALDAGWTPRELSTRTGWSQCSCEQALTRARRAERSAA